MNCIIRKIRQSEIQVLSDFLYKAIFIPEGAAKPPRKIMKQPELQVYVSDFGKPMLKELKERGYKHTSLAVQKANYAIHMYRNVGFEIVEENEEEYIMVCKLSD